MAAEGIAVRLNVNCNECEKPCSNRCGNCHKVAYCSKECQVKNWKSHKSDCVPVEIRICPETNRRSLFITKDFPAGSIAWKEKPLAYGCFNTLKYDDFRSGSNQTTYCFTCCAELKPGVGSRCPRCERDVCNEVCAQSPFHASNECQLFRNFKLSGGLTTYIGVTPTELTLLIRLKNLKMGNPGDWEKLLKLNQNPEQVNLASLSPLHDELSEDLLMWLRDNPVSPVNQVSLNGLPSRQQSAWIKFAGTRDLLTRGGQDWDLKETENLLGLMDWNSMEDYSQSFVKWICYYGSSFRQSCNPNTVWRVDAKKQVHFRLLTDMRAGDEIFMTKESYNLHQGTPRRQFILQDMRQLICKCDRCTDPTELGTFAAAVKCPEKNCSGGYLLPEKACTPGDYLSITLPYIWKCHGCQKKVNTIQETGLIVKTQNIIHENQGCFQALIAKFLQLISQYEGTRLHPNHYELITIKELITQQLSDVVILALMNKKTTITTSAHGTVDIKYCAMLTVKYSQFLLGIRNPGFAPFTHRRGKLLLYQFSGAAYIYKYEDPHDLVELGMTLGDILATRKEADEILSFYANDRFEDQNRIACMKRIQEWTMLPDY